MQIEIWSDVMCPFCYIGKRRFEKALSGFAHKDEVELVWKSFRLNPQLKTDPSKNVNHYLSEIKGWPLEQAKAMNARVTEMARQEGLEYNFDKAIVANSFDAHRLVQLAKKHDLGDAMEERLFRAYFTEGANTADHATLTRLGAEIGLEESAVDALWKTNLFAEDVHRDEEEARQLGIRGVPFFLFARRYAVSGAQDSAVFLQALETAYAESKKT